MSIKRCSVAIVSRTGIDPFIKGRGEDQLSYTHVSAVPWHLLNSLIMWWGKTISFPGGGPLIPTNGNAVNFRPMGKNSHKFHFCFSSYIGGCNELHLVSWSLLMKQWLNLLNRQPHKYLLTQLSAYHPFSLSRQSLWLALLETAWWAASCCNDSLSLPCL